MVEKLCRDYGTPLLHQPGAQQAQQELLLSPGKGGLLAFHAFPTLEQLAAATEEELRAAGFGYRAKYIVAATEVLRSKPGGGDAWLMGLREADYPSALEALESIPGVGPKAGSLAGMLRA